jgi:hypothetical protein
MTHAEYPKQPEGDRLLNPAGTSEAPPKGFILFCKDFWLETCTRVGEDGETKRQPNLLGHSLIAGALLLFMGGNLIWLNSFANAKANQWFGDPIRRELAPFKQDLGEELSPETRLREQLAEIQYRREKHSVVMLHFYERHFVSLSMASGSALIAATCLFFISKQGWKNVNNSLINVFVVTSSIALLFNQLPQLFEHDINIEVNRKLYLQYVALENQVRSYLATQGTLGTDSPEPNQFETIEINQFICNVDKELEELNQIPLQFDASQVIKVQNFMDSQLGDSMTAQPGSEPSN